MLNSLWMWHLMKNWWLKKYVYLQQNKFLRILKITDIKKLEHISYKKFLPGIAWFFVVLFLICIPGKDVPEVGWLSGIPNFDKIVHVGIFGMLGALFSLPFKKSSLTNKQRIQYITGILIAVSIWGLTTEFIQKFFIPGRNFDLLDWVADTFGALLTFFFFLKKFSKTTADEI